MKFISLGYGNSVAVDRVVALVSPESAPVKRLMQDAKEMVSIATKLKGKIVLRSGSKFSVNAKSLLGVLLAKKLNWNDIKIEMENDYYHEFEKFIVD